MLANEEKLREELLSKIPPRNEPPLPPDWLSLEMLERFRVLRFTHLGGGMNVLEVGCGAHAITTVPLAYLVGETGRVVAVDKARWRFFEEITSAAGVKHRIIPLSSTRESCPFPLRRLTWQFSFTASEV